VCRGPAVVDVRRHNANFCSDHFVRYCRRRVERAIDSHAICRPDEQLLVAVWGGKDSLALWDILLDLGYRADGLFIGLGIDGYSDASVAHARRFAHSRRAALVEIDLDQEFGYTIPTAAGTTGRVPCSACGLSKRHLFDRAAVKRGYGAVATGHNLDDEAAVLFYYEFLRRGRCRSCDGPTDSEVCAFCRLVDRVAVR
jgi:tRNA(Ile)-lysidine synthase TilS/MesJ